jgi:ubiquinone/menaquinone biosynthesis C-methylase UbiE
MIDSRYVHGYSIRETVRLADQASTLSGLLLDCGCGTGAQTIVLAAGSPEAQIVSIDIAPVSIEQARRRIETGGHRNVTFQVASIFDLPFEDQSRHSRLVRCM